MCGCLPQHRRRPTESLAAQPVQQILRVHRFGEDVELVPVLARLLEQIGSGRLALKQENLDRWQQCTNANGRIDSVQVGHDHV